MTPEAAAGAALLSARTDEEYGGGTELPTTGFLVLGLLTFWIYTVWKYHSLLSRHMSARLRYFRGQLDPSSLADHPRQTYEALVEKGFHLRAGARNLALAFYGLSLALILSELVAEILYLRRSISVDAFYDWVYAAAGGAALLFCAASIYFISWAARATRVHEYHELLLARLVRDPEGFRVVQPSAKFIRRWDRNQSRVALFLILAVPMTISPIFAAMHIHQAQMANLDFTTPLVIWLVVLFGFAAVFHLWGTQLLLDMHNGHLRTEELNQGIMAEPGPWVPDHTPSVLDERREGAPRDGPGELLPRRILAAIMITDMVGFSRDMEHSEERTYSKLMKHNDIVRASLAQHSGNEVKTIGDAFLVRFDSAVNAVKAAVDIQGALIEYNEERGDDERIVVRIGIHTGDVLTMDGDVLGNNVNLAARIEPLAEPGGICISAATYENVRSTVDVAVSRLGRQALKNIEDPPELFTISRESIRAAALS
jgi:class 3 adenylate cyclase